MLANSSPRFVFVGCGNMGEAILNRVLAQNITTKDKIMVVTKTAVRQKHLNEIYDVQVSSLEAAAQNADLVIIAVKPQQLDELPSIELNPETVVVSVLAGTLVSKIKAKVGGKIVRAMPNLGFKVGQGITGLYFDNSVKWSEAQTKITNRMFESGGLVFNVHDEQKLDAITALSGSGPAYYYWFSEVLADAANKIGFTKEESDILVRQTFIGAAEILKTEEEDFLQLRHQITSKGGTTEAAIEVLSQSNLKMAVLSAIEAALQRSKDLG